MPCGADRDFEPIQAPNGRYYHVSQTNVRQRDKLLCTCIIMYDITQAKQKLDTLSREASYDALTQIYNRGTFFQMAKAKFEAIFMHGGQFAVLMFDLDHFKQVNDTYGHPCGDVVLHTLAQRLSARVRETDILGRYGGEEFCAFLTHITPEHAMQLAELLRQSVEEEPFLCGENRLPLTVSVGVSAFDPEAHKTLEDMIADADRALYAAKEGGRNRVVLFAKEEN